jgi:hypothetical protein
MSSNEREIKSLMKFGAGLVVFGLVCPFFWLSLFASGSKYETWVYGVHSGIFIRIGLVLLGKGRYDMKCMRVNPGLNKPEH